jgi:DNA-binding LacI/PurR family transcriptional regulator
VTSVDVAREAGVSRATVSYVLNDTPNQRIPEATRRRVWEAVERLGYAPSAAARTLRRGRSDVVLWLLPDWPIGPMVGRVLEGLAVALAEAGLALVAHPRAGNRRPVSEVWRAISPGAVIVWETLEPDDVAAMRAAGIDVILVLMGGDGPAGNGLEISEQRTGRLQVEHLAARGHRRIGYAHSHDERLLTFAGPRLAGVRAACADLGLDPPDVRTVGLDAERAADAVSRWRTATPAVTGVCAYNDEVALAVLAGLHAHRLRAPDDLAVVGVDNIPIAPLADPPLTSVFVDPERLVDYIVRGVLAGLSGEPAPAAPGSDIVRIADRGSA